MGQALARNNHAGENKKKKVLKLKSKEYFIQNGGILLEKRVALGHGQDTGAGLVKVLSAKDIEKARDDCYEPLHNHSNHSHIADWMTENHADWMVYKATFENNADWIVYKGTLENHAVTILASRNLNPDPTQINVTLTAASASMVMNHDGLAKLYGCCLETCIPMLVFEFFPNHNLYAHLHGDMAFRKRLKWPNLLRIAADVSYVLSYMHSALSKPVVHRDIRSCIIFLDDSFQAKLGPLGACVSITPNATSAKWPFHGIPGYTDPEYLETQEVTEKCDVYSFGVLMLEIITRRSPRAMARNGIDLVDVFVSAVKRNCMMEIVDRDILNQASREEIEQVAQLALTCVAKKGVERPTMVEVTGKLWQIQDYNSK